MKRPGAAIIVAALVFGIALPQRSAADPLDPNNYASLGTLDVSSGSVTFVIRTTAYIAAFAVSLFAGGTSAGAPCFSHGRVCFAAWRLI